MKKALFHSLFTTVTFIAVAFGFLSTSGIAMHAPDMDPHLSYLRKAMNEHGFHPSHFSLAPGEEAVEYKDVNDHIKQRIQALHASHLESLTFKPTPTPQPTSTDSSWWNMLPSMPRLWARTTPTSDLENGSPVTPLSKELSDPSPLTLSGFYLIPSTTSESEPALPIPSSSTVLQPTSSNGGTIPILPSTPESIVLGYPSPANVSIIDNYSRRSLETVPVDLGLSLMGGGGRGYMGLLWLKRLMDETKAPIWRIFPCIAGVSVGAILGLGMANPYLELSELDSFFTTDFDQVFPQESSWNYPVKIWDSARSIFYPQFPAEPLEVLLRKRNGTTTMDQLLTDVVATAINTKTNELRPFSRETDGPVPIWEVQRASSAAPTKFKAYEINGIPYIDGGLGENNPVLRLLLRMRELSQLRQQPFSLDTATILSLGTGDMPVHSIPDNAGISSAGLIVNTSIDVQSNAADMTARSLVKNYTFINPKLSKVIPLDVLNDEIRALLREAAESKYEDIEKFAHLDIVQRQLERAVY